MAEHASQHGDGPIDVAIIGGGIVGLSCALEALVRGLSVAVIDPGQARQRASYGNAGVISRGSILPPAGPAIWKNLFRYGRGADAGFRLHYPALPATWAWLYHFLRHANEKSWRRAAGALNALTAPSYDAHIRLATMAGARDLIARNGWLKLYRSEEAFASSALEREILAEHKVRTDILDGEEIARLEPSLKRRFARAAFFPETGSIDNPGELIERYRAAFLAGGGKWIAAEVARIEVDADRAKLSWPGGDVVAGHAVLAAGAHSAGLARQLGYRIPLAAERGYHLHFRLKDGARLGRPIYDTGGAYVLSPMNINGACVRVLSGAEIARPGDAPTPVQLNRILPEAIATLDLAAPLENTPWHGNRPSTPDGLPVIGRGARHRRLIFAFGHGHIGLSTGPVTGRLVADLLSDAAPTIDLAPYGAQRFTFGL